MDYISEYGGLRCDCQENEKQPRKRTIKDGRVTYGYQCQNCGRFEQKSMKSFGWDLPSQFIDESISERFNDRCQRHWQKQREDMQSEWRNGYEAYLQSAAWKKKREAALKRDNYICQSCLQKRADHVHHLDYKYLGREPLWDLVSVCIDCHRSLHPHMQEQKEIGIDWDSFNTGS